MHSDTHTINTQHARKRFMYACSVASNYIKFSMIFKELVLLKTNCMIIDNLTKLIVINL